MGILASLLNFLGCSEQVNSNKNSTEKPVNDTLKDDLAKMFHKFNNRPIYKKLTTEIIDFTPDALLLVGANKWADLVKKANHVFESEKKKIKNHQDGTLEGFSKSYEDNPLNDLDTEFYDLYKIEDLHKLQVDFIRKNKQDFVDE